MMRCAIFALATFVLLTGAVLEGCADDDAPGYPDLGDYWDFAPTVVIEPVVRIGCSGYVDCDIACQMTAGTQAEYDACTQACKKKTKTGVFNTSGTGSYDKALACGRLYCLGDVDAGTAKCLLDTESTQLINADGSEIKSSDPGTGVKACGACLENALAGLFKTDCPDAGSADCNPAQCASLTTACLDDQPVVEHPPH